MPGFEGRIHPCFDLAWRSFKKEKEEQFCDFKIDSTLSTRTLRCDWHHEVLLHQYQCFTTISYILSWLRDVNDVSKSQTTVTCQLQNNSANSSPIAAVCNMHKGAHQAVVWLRIRRYILWDYPFKEEEMKEEKRKIEEKGGKAQGRRKWVGLRQALSSHSNLPYMLHCMSLHNMTFVLFYSSLSAFLSTSSNISVKNNGE